ncbi:hypothetical protein HW555_001773 [Spodoptera exigua]|uniref:Uncharacterized protein n=1 Tax=Spodoptera exigua TaxID=7107 RepID=A0A835GRF0_SPOEX|nr:hypothetical protein HW555_001773 [Spodoptera exigua]
MNKTLRRGRGPHRDSPPRTNAYRNKGQSGVENIPHSSFRPRCKEKNVASRCCYVTPDQKDFGQSYGIDRRSIESRDKRLHRDMFTGKNSFQNDHNQTLKNNQQCFDPIKVETIAPSREKIKKVLYTNDSKVESRPHYTQRATSPVFVEAPDGSQWQNVDNTDNLDTIIMNEDPPAVYERLKNHIYISEVPQIKIIAEKFSKYKKNNIELRRLDEKVVCVEYDIYDPASKEDLKPIQRMRAFFSIKPVVGDGCGNHESKLPTLPSNIKQQFNILDEDLKKLTDKEIEIIDGKIEENRSYLDDLRRILKRKQVIRVKRNRTALDLESLYEMAKRDMSSLGCRYSGANLLSKEELQEVKDLILHRCASSVHGIRRKSLKRKEKGSAKDFGVISQSIVAELWRDDAKLNV